MEPVVACPDAFRSAIKLPQLHLPRQGFLAHGGSGAADRQEKRDAPEHLRQEWKEGIRQQLKNQGSTTGLWDARTCTQAEQKSIISKRTEGQERQSQR